MFRVGHWSNLTWVLNYALSWRLVTGHTRGGTNQNCNLGPKSSAGEMGSVAPATLRAGFAGLNGQDARGAPLVENAGGRHSASIVPSCFVSPERTGLGVRRPFPHGAIVERWASAVHHDPSTGDFPRTRVRIRVSGPSMSSMINDKDTQDTSFSICVSRGEADERNRVFIFVRSSLSTANSRRVEPTGPGPRRRFSNGPSVAAGRTHHRHGLTGSIAQFCSRQTPRGPTTCCSQVPVTTPLMEPKLSPSRTNPEPSIAHLGTPSGIRPAV